MLPLRDDAPTKRFAFVTYSLIAINILVFFVELSSPDLEVFFQTWGFVPANFEVTSISTWIPMFSSMFLHGGFLHIGSNMWFLHIFGDNTEDNLGPLAFVLLYFLGGIAATMSQYLAEPDSVIPLVGASGAIAAVLGYYAVFFPHHRVTTLIPLGPVIRTIHLPALIVLGFWFVTQTFQGMTSLAVSNMGGVAWWAHIGGFVFGMLYAILFRLMGKKP